MQLKDLTNYIVPEPIQLPVGGRVYTVPPASAEIGLWCQATYTAASAADEDEEAAARAKIPQFRDAVSLDEVLLGEAYQQMLADGVEHDMVRVCTGTVYLYIVAGEQAAQAFWEAGGDVEKVRRPVNNRAERRARRTGESSTAAGVATPAPGSTSGTSSRRRSGRSRRSR